MSGLPSSSDEGLRAPSRRHALVRVVHFRARHRYGRAEWSEARNREVFGAQVESHEHRFRIEITVSGPLDPRTGFVADLEALDRLIEARLLRPLADSDLNRAIPEVAEGRMQPSTEALADWVFRSLAAEVEAPARVERVRVWESDTLGGEARRV